MRRWATAAMVAALLGSGPALGAPAPNLEEIKALKALLLGPVEDVPTDWGSDPIGYDPAAVTEISLLGSSADPDPADRAPPPPSSIISFGGLPYVPPPPAPPPPPPPPGPRAADQVGGLTVVGRARTAIAAPTVEKCVTGPAWWRVADKDTVVWIMGTPDQMPMNTVWDDTCLVKRMAAARVVIAPAIPPTTVENPFTRANTPLRQTDQPLDKRLPAPLWAQLSQRINANTVRAEADAQWARTSDVQDMPPELECQLAPPSAAGCDRMIGGLTDTRGPLAIRTTLQVLQDTPNLFAPTTIVAQRLALSLSLPGNLGNPAASRMVELAGRANALIGRTKNSEAQFSTMTFMGAPSETEQQACLKKVLDEMDAGQDAEGTQARIQAWANGDYQNALKRMNVLNTCPFGDISVRFWSAVVAQYMELIDRALKSPGVAVAVVEYDPFFLKNGVLERLKANKALTITPPEGLR